MFDRVLLPIDGSDVVEPAVKMALDIARTYDATIHALYVVEPPAFGGAGDVYTGINTLVETLREEGERATTEIADRANDNNIEAIPAVQRGRPQDKILTYAHDHEIDLIVIGTHGRTGVKRALLGSVTETVVRHSEIPVLTVHRNPRED